MAVKRFGKLPQLCIILEGSKIANAFDRQKVYHIFMVFIGLSLWVFCLPHQYEKYMEFYCADIVVGRFPFPISRSHTHISWSYSPHYDHSVIFRYLLRSPAFLRKNLWIRFLMRGRTSFNLEFNAVGKKWINAFMHNLFVCVVMFPRVTHRTIYEQSFGSIYNYIYISSNRRNIWTRSMESYGGGLL